MEIVYSILSEWSGLILLSVFILAALFTIRHRRRLIRWLENDHYRSRKERDEDEILKAQRDIEDAETYINRIIARQKADTQEAEREDK